MWLRAPTLRDDVGTSLPLDGLRDNLRPGDPKYTHSGDQGPSMALDCPAFASRAAARLRRKGTLQQRKAGASGADSL